MRSRWILRSVLAILAIPHLGRAQESINVDAATLDQHVAHRVAPVYPPIAKAARIQGTIVFQVRVGVSGNIESTTVVSGPAMLQQAAIDCVKHWTFQPFERDGKPAPASGQISIDFSLGKDGPTASEEKIADRYFPLADQCRKLLSSRADYPAAATACKQAADTANEFAPGVRFIERRSAFVYAATAYADAGNLKDALPWADKAVATVKLGHDDDSGSNAAYSTKGNIEGMLGDLASADQDLATAEDFERKGIVSMEKDSPGIAGNYRRVLARDLRFHAQVLQHLNRPDEAKKKLDEAAKYD